MGKISQFSLSSCQTNFIKTTDLEVLMVIKPRKHSGMLAGRKVTTICFYPISEMVQY